MPVVRDTTTLKKEATKAASPCSLLKGDYMLSLFPGKKEEIIILQDLQEPQNIFSLIFFLCRPTVWILSFQFRIQTEDKYFIEESRRRDTLKVWLTDSTLYSQSQVSTIIKYPFTDTLGVVDYKSDTIPMRFITPRASRGTKVKAAALKVENNITGGAIKPGVPVVFRTESPFQTARYNTYKTLRTCLIQIKLKFLICLKQTPLNSGRLIMKAKLLQTKKYLFIADSAAFSNILNEYSDSIGIKFSVRETDSYGKLTMNITNCQGTSIIQLLNNSEKLVAEATINKDGKIVFPLLENGFYRLRVIYDLNGDGQWTTGDYFTGRQPEPVSYYESEVEMKSNFEI